MDEWKKTPAALEAQLKIQELTRIPDEVLRRMVEIQAAGLGYTVEVDKPVLVGDHYLANVRIRPVLPREPSASEIATDDDATED